MRIIPQQLDPSHIEANSFLAHEVRSVKHVLDAALQKKYILPSLSLVSCFSSETVPVGVATSPGACLL